MILIFKKNLLRTLNYEQVEDIISHKLDKDEWKYLIKWKDHARGETWETAKRTKVLCPDILEKFMEKLTEVKQLDFDEWPLES